MYSFVLRLAGSRRKSRSSGWLDVREDKQQRRGKGERGKRERGKGEEGKGKRKRGGTCRKMCTSATVDLLKAGWSSPYLSASEY